MMSSSSMNVSEPLYSLSHAATKTGGTDFSGLHGVNCHVVRNMVKSRCNATMHDKDGFLPFSGLFHQATENDEDFMGLATQDITILRTTT